MKNTEDRNREDENLRRMLKTPHKPHASAEKKIAAKSEETREKKKPV